MFYRELTWGDRVAYAIAFVLLLAWMFLGDAR